MADLEALSQIDLFENDQLNDDQLNDDQLNDDQLNDDQLNDDQLNDDQLNDDQLNDEDISTITQLAEELELDPSSLYGLQVPMGEGVEPITLSELKDYYQKSSRDNIQGKYDELARQNSELQEQLQTVQTTGSQMSQEVMNAEMELRRINDIYESIDWNLFEKENPGEAALQRQKIQDAFNQALVVKENAVNKMSHDQAQRDQEYSKEQAIQIMELIPEWKDQATYDSEKEAIKSMLYEYGFSDKDIREVKSAKAIRLLNDLARYKTSMSNAQQLRQERDLNRKPSTIRSGSLRRATLDKEKDLNNRIAAATKSKDKRVKAAVISELIS